MYIYKYIYTRVLRALRARTGPWALVGPPLGPGGPSPGPWWALPWAPVGPPLGPGEARALVGPPLGPGGAPGPAGPPHLGPEGAPGPDGPFPRTLEGLLPWALRVPLTKTQTKNDVQLIFIIQTRSLPQTASFLNKKSKCASPEPSNHQQEIPKPHQHKCEFHKSALN